MATNLQSASRAALNRKPSTFGAGAAVADILSAQNLKKAGAGLQSANTIPELEKAIADGEKALGIQSKVQTAVDVADVAGNLSATSQVLSGNLPTVGNVAAQGAVQMIPFGGLASAVIPDKYDPIAKGANLLSGTVDKIPGVPTFNRGIAALGKGIKQIPGTGTASQIAGGLSVIPDQVLMAPVKVFKSFSDAEQQSAHNDRVAAIQTHLQLLGNSLTEDTWIGTIPGTRSASYSGGAGGTFQTNVPINMTVSELRQDPAGREALANISSEISGVGQLQDIEAEENALMQDIMSTDPYTGEAPMHNIKSYDDYSNLNIGTAYTDEHGTWDAMTGEPVDPLNPIRTQPAPMPPASVTTPAPVQPALTPLERLAELRGDLDEIRSQASPIIKSTPIRKTQAGGPGPSRFFAPSQPAPKVETGPRRTFGSTSYDRRKFYGLTGGTRR